MKKIVRILLILCIVTYSHWASAVAYQSHHSIREAVHRFLMEELADNGDDITVRVGRLDPRLRLKQCGAPLHLSLPASSRRAGGVTVKVGCEDSVIWGIYVQSDVERFGSVMVAQRELHRGDIISREDLELNRVSLGKIRGGYITKIENILGWEVKRAISVGKIVSPNSIRRPLLVKRGDIVVIIAKSNNFEVKMSGVAKSSGAKGDTVKVINQSSKKMVEGIVIGPGVVQVPM